MFQGIEAVIFDLDGTLVDSMWMWKEIDIVYLGRFGLTVPDDLQKEIEGMSDAETAVYFQERFGIPRTVEQIRRDWEEMAYDNYSHHVPLKPGVRPFLNELKRRGIRTGIATSNGKVLVDAVLSAHDLTGFFDSVHMACEVERGKPAPDIYLKVAQDLSVEPEHCLVFEDIPAGILAARRAGMRVCAVEDAFSLHRKEEKKQLADAYLTSYEDIRYE